jgi:hypothetical protein
VCEMYWDSLYDLEHGQLLKIIFHVYLDCELLLGWEALYVQLTKLIVLFKFLDFFMILTI